MASRSPACRSRRAHRSASTATFASHVTIRNVNSYNNGYWGIFTGFVNDLLIENNITSGSVIEHGIYVSNSGDRPMIRNNVVFEQSRQRHPHERRRSARAATASSPTRSSAATSSTTTAACGGGSGINMDGVQNSRIENNLLYNNHASGISLYSIDGGGGSTGNVVVNNTVYQASRRPLGAQHPRRQHRTTRSATTFSSATIRTRGRDRHLDRQPARVSRATTTS